MSTTSTMRNSLLSFGITALALLASCGSHGGRGGGGGGGGSQKSLVSIEIAPALPSIALGTQQPLIATGIFSDVSTQDLTDQVTWSSSDTNVASISNDVGSQGLALGLAVGDTTISATLSGMTGLTTLSVTSAVLTAIEVTPSVSDMALGTNQQLAATGTFSDLTTQDLTAQVVWSSSDEAVVAVSNLAGNNGQAFALAVGSADVSAELAGINGSTLLTVTNAVLASIEVTPVAPSIALGTTQPFVATGIYTDNSKQDLTAQATWAVSDEAVATISNAAGSAGQASSVAVGNVDISATFAGTVGWTSLEVTNAVLVSLEVAPNDAVLALGTEQQFTATGVFSDATIQDLTAQALWSSTNISVATISNAAGSQGFAVSLSVGATDISAAFAGISATVPLVVSNAQLVSIEVEPDVASIAAGTLISFTATGIYSDDTAQDLTNQVTWSSSNPSAASISNVAQSQGVAKGLAVGSTTISADFAGESGTAILDVTDAFLVSLQVVPDSLQLPYGLQRQLAAMGTFSDASVQDLTAQVIWATSNNLVAVVSNAAGSSGLMDTLGTGIATISATQGAISDSASITVTNAALVSIQVAPGIVDLPTNFKSNFSATGNYSDGSAIDLTSAVLWSSSAPAIATISNAPGMKGTATAVAAGNVTISATYQGVIGTASMSVIDETLVSITVSPSSDSLLVGDQVQLQAIGHFSAGSTIDLTQQVNWISTPRSVASVGKTTHKGLVTAKSSGNAMVRAKKISKQGTATISVN